MLAGMSAKPVLNVILQGKHHFGSTVYYKHTRTVTDTHTYVQRDVCSETHAQNTLVCKTKKKVCLLSSI